MKFLKSVSLVLVFVMLTALFGCTAVDGNLAVSSESESTSSVSEASSSPQTDDENPKITSLDTKMSKYFDISYFDEENYANIYLDKEFRIKAQIDKSDFSLPTTMRRFIENGWNLVEGSDYDANSLVFANDIIELDFVNENGAELTALLYNSSNASIYLSECNIVKIHYENDYVTNKTDYIKFNVNGITNTAAISDIISTLGTPSHFYKKNENNYYFDYFLDKNDRRNKIRVYVNLSEDLITAIEFANYK